MGEKVATVLATVHSWSSGRLETPCRRLELHALRRPKAMPQPAVCCPRAPGPSGKERVSHLSSQGAALPLSPRLQGSGLSWEARVQIPLLSLAGPGLGWGLGRSFHDGDFGFPLNAGPASLLAAFHRLPPKVLSSSITFWPFHVCPWLFTLGRDPASAIRQELVGAGGLSL